MHKLFEAAEYSSRRCIGYIEVHLCCFAARNEKKMEKNRVQIYYNVFIAYRSWCDLQNRTLYFWLLKDTDACRSGLILQCLPVSLLVFIETYTFQFCQFSDKSFDCDANHLIRCVEL